MEKIRLIIPTRVEHCAQIITGFLMLKEQGWEVEVIDNSRKPNTPYRDLPAVQAEYRGKKLFYDVWDGYQDPEDMELGLEFCDYYFKRSFSQEKTGNYSQTMQKKSTLLALIIMSPIRRIQSGNRSGRQCCAHCRGERRNAISCQRYLKEMGKCPAAIPRESCFWHGSGVGRTGWRAILPTTSASR